MSLEKNTVLIYKAKSRALLCSFKNELKETVLFKITIFFICLIFFITHIFIIFISLFTLDVRTVSTGYQTKVTLSMLITLNSKNR